MKHVKAIGGDFDLPSIGLGTMGFGGYFKNDHLSPKDSVSVIEAAFDAGIRVIDTAEIYAEGASEEIIGQVSNVIRDQLFIMSKFSAENSLPAGIRSAIEKTLGRIRRDYVDVYQPHWPNPDVPFDDILETLEKLKTEGKIKHIGLSNHDISHIERTKDLTVSSVRFMQAEFNPIERSSFLNFSKDIEENDGALIAYSPFREGQIFHGDQVKTLSNIARSNNCSSAQLILAWVINHDRVIAIPKSSSISRVLENAAAMTLDIHENDFNRVSDLFQVSITEIPPRFINSVSDIESNNRNVYTNLDDARRNILGLSPGPEEIAEEIRANGGRLFKPIKVKQISGTKQYILVEGRLRYWAWIILYGEDLPISAIVLH
jgi:diketogulonate reductase-like aldo/keto reductase